MPNPKIAEAGKATRFKKGNVPVSPGRPKKTSVSEAYARLIDKQLPDDIRRKLGLPARATWADALALGQLRSAIKGKTDAAREIADRLEGRSAQSVDLNANLSVNRVAEMERRWRERSAQRSPANPAAVNLEP